MLVLLASDVLFGGHCQHRNWLDAISLCCMTGTKADASLAESSHLDRKNPLRQTHSERLEAPVLLIELGRSEEQATQEAAAGAAANVFRKQGLHEAVLLSCSGL